MKDGIIYGSGETLCTIEEFIRGFSMKRWKDARNPIILQKLITRFVFCEKKKTVCRLPVGQLSALKSKNTK